MSDTRSGKMERNYLKLAELIELYFGLEQEIIREPEKIKAHLEKEDEADNKKS